MTIPDSIPLSSIILGERGRKTYSGIEQLAESIAAHGLIQPIVLVPIGWEGLDGGISLVNPKQVFGLDAGGRRFHALKFLNVETLYHATTSEPGKPGFVLKGEDQSSPLKRLMTEIAENLDREDPDWRDEVAMITKAWRLAKADADSSGERLLMRDFGAMLGTGYSDLQAANAVHDDVIANPEFYKDVSGLRMAYSKLLNKNAKELTRLIATKSLVQSPLSVEVQNEPKPEVPRVEGEPEPVVIPLTQSFLRTDSIKFMSELPPDQFDHIVTDPDYGVSVERLEASVADAASGVDQKTVDESLATMVSFLNSAFHILRSQGFCIFWYDLDHHEKLQNIAKSVGFRVQRWPLIWHKTDYRSNAAPAHNFCKNLEYAMVCRKPNAVLVRSQMSSIYSCASANTVKQFGHPFAKPPEVWTWIFNAIAIKGQVVYDPFLGSGSSAVAALNFGLRPVGTEIDIDHYSSAVLNIQAAYKRLVGDHVRFI